MIKDVEVVVLTKLVVVLTKLDFFIHPEYKFPGDMKHNYLQTFVETDTEFYQLPFNISITGVEARVIPWDQFLYTGVEEIRRRRTETACDSCLSARRRRWELL
ncbi:hypothetical protein AVEN_127531-1 [Araneus ventricosus]|uniref:Uncharacterized protein n=1 Tax=Araneus ventricosus TaxID=182803 RepID=A0A4Y2HR06_ARAVE|nr:hypothetical protein AVEN_127531-1 [Araneus ventricosus]